MPKQLTSNEFVCVHCGAKYKDEELAKHHEIYDHDIVYLPIEKTDLNRLLNFIVTNHNNEQLLTERLMNTLFKFTRV
jgi:hypothetical protein